MLNMPEELQIELIAILVGAVTTLVGGGYFTSLSFKWRLIANIVEAVVARVGREYVSKMKEKNQQEIGAYDLTAAQENTAFNTAFELIQTKAPANVKPLIKANPEKIQAMIQNTVRTNKAVQRGRNNRVKGQ